MDYRCLFATGARLLGLYFVISAVASVPEIIVANKMMAHEPDFGTSFAWLNAAQCAIYLIAGAALLIVFRACSAVPGTDASGLFAGLRLLSVYFVVSGLSWVASHTAHAFVTPELVVERLLPALGGALTFIAGLVLWPLATRLAAPVPPTNSCADQQRYRHIDSETDTQASGTQDAARESVHRSATV